MLAPAPCWSRCCCPCCCSCTRRSALWLGPFRRLCCAWRASCCCRCWRAPSARSAARDRAERCARRHCGHAAAADLFRRWPQRLNIEYWFDADRGRAHWWVQPLSLRLPAALAAAARFDPAAARAHGGTSCLASLPMRRRCAGGAGTDANLDDSRRFAAGPRQQRTMNCSLRSSRGAPEAFVVFPAAANIQEIVVATPAGPRHAKLQKLRSGATRLLWSAFPDRGSIRDRCRSRPNGRCRCST